MFDEKHLNMINKLTKNRVFSYYGELLYDVDYFIDFQYKIKLLEYSNDKLIVEVKFVKYDDFLKSIVKNLTDSDTRDSYLHYFKSNLIKEIRSFLIIFATETNLQIILKFKDKDENDLINENDMSKLATRTVVKDIINKVKNKKRGFFHLPNGNDDYHFTNLPFTFTVELTLRVDVNIDRFKTNGYYVPEEEVIEVLVLFNPNKIQSQLTDLIGELNVLISHELEHGFQEYRGEFQKKSKEPKKSLPYYTQDHEIPAQYKGFKRLSKLTKKPLEVVIKEWFENNKDIHKMTDNEIKIVIGKVLEYEKQK
jgi:hypothetical protein